MKFSAFALACALFSNVCIAQTPPTQIVKLDISTLHPTQPSIGYRQVAYKLNRYQQEPKRFFSNYCETIGAGKLKEYSEQSTLKQLDSFECQDKVATHLDAMKTVVQAPNGEYYLTDGHHFVSEIVEKVGQDVPVYLLVTPDMHRAKNMKQFAKQMQKKNLTWLKKGDQQIKFADLPQTFNRNELQNDEYRSLMFFMRDISFGKPEVAAPPFYEFYMADWIRHQVPLKDLNLSNPQNYLLAIQKVGQAMTSANPNEGIARIKGKNYTVKDFGIFQKFNQDKYQDLLDPKSKVYEAFNQ